MAAPFFQLERKLEVAVLDILEVDGLDGVPIYIASDTADETEEGEAGIRLPYVMIAARDCRQEMEGQIDGVFVITCEVTVYTHRHDEPGEAHSEKVGVIRDILFDDGIASAISTAAEDLRVLLVRDISTSENRTGATYETTTTLELVVVSIDA